MEDTSNYIIEKAKVSIEKAHEIAFFSFGKPGLALNFLSSPQKIIKQKKSFEDFIKIVNSDLFIRFASAKLLSMNREKTNESLENWLKYFRLTLINRILGNSEHWDLINNQRLSRFSNKALIKIIQSIEKTKLIISTTNVNSKLALENLLINI